MTVLQQLYPGDEVASFAIRVLLEVSSVTLAALLFARAFARKNPALRHGVCVCALFCVLLAPISTMALQRAGWRTFQIQLDHETAALPGSESLPRMEVAARQVPAQPFWSIERARSAASATLLVWILGTGVLLLRLIRTATKVNRLRRSSYTVESEKVASVMDELTQIDGLPAVPVRYLKRLHSPVVIGTLRPSVILPEKLVNQLDDAQLRSVLAHELAHVRNRDPLIGFIQRVVEASYWPHPLVHLLNRDLVRAREEVCDNAALHSTTAPQYAETLLCVALGMKPGSLPSGAIGLMTPPWKLEERVKGLLDPQRRLTTKMNTRHLALMTVLLAAGTTVIAGTRVVAAPTPQQQETVELTTHVNSKTHSVSVTAVKTKKVSPAPKQIKVMVYAHPVMTKKTPETYSVTSRQDGKNRFYSITTEAVKSEDKIVRDLPRTQEIKTITTTTTEGGKQKETTETITVESTSNVDLAKVVDAQAGTTITTEPIKGRIVEVAKTSPEKTEHAQKTYRVLVKGEPASRYETLYVTDVHQLGDAKRIKLLQGKAVNSDLRIKLADDINREVILKMDAKAADNGQAVTVLTNAEDAKIADDIQIAYATEPGSKVTQAIPFRVTRPSQNPTTVYIQGGKIKVVGDRVNVVYLNPQPKKTTPSKAKKPKAKG